MSERTQVRRMAMVCGLVAGVVVLSLATAERAPHRVLAAEQAPVTVEIEVIEPELIPAGVRGFEQLAGSADRDRLLFESDRLACYGCHEVDSGAESYYPHLGAVGERLTLRQLALAVLAPSREFAPSWKRVIVEFTDGRLLKGTELTAESTAALLVLVDEMGLRREVPRSAIELVESLPSDMPEGLVESAELTAHEFADLLAYLQSLRGEQDASF